MAWDLSSLAQNAGPIAAALTALLAHQRASFRTIRRELREGLKEVRQELKEQSKASADQAVKLEVVISRLGALEGQRVTRMEGDIASLREHFHKLSDAVQGLLNRSKAAP